MSFFRLLVGSQLKCTDSVPTGPYYLPTRGGDGFGSPLRFLHVFSAPWKQNFQPRHHHAWEYWNSEKMFSVSPTWVKGKSQMGVICQNGAVQWDAKPGIKKTPQKMLNRSHPIRWQEEDECASDLAPMFYSKQLQKILLAIIYPSRWSENVSLLLLEQKERLQPS